MKLTTILLIVSFIQVTANSYSQSTRLDLKFDNESLEKAFRKIEENSEFSIFYKNELIQSSAKINGNFKNASVSEILNKILDSENLSYLIKDKLILIISKNSEYAKSVQQQKITGSIVDASTKEPLPGVNVIIEGTTVGTVSDVDGKYSITVPKSNSVLVFSSVGYNSERVQLSGQAELNISLIPDIKSLEEVVVVGYGTQKKRDVTGSVAIVKAEDLNINASSNFAQALQGKAAGIQVTQATGQPGANVSVQLRSNPSNANAGVLYVIDGVPVNDNAGTPTSAKYGTSGVDQSPLNFINSNDIESISFLKDASSASIYGARAGAGVVLITTKRGNSGTPKVTYSASYGIQKVDKLIQLLNTKEYMNQANLVGEELWLRDNKIAPYYGTVDPSLVTPYVPRYTQAEIDNTPEYPGAMNAIFKQGYTHQQNLSIAGGNDKSSYFVSANYFDQLGTLSNSGIKRYNGKINFDQSLSKNIKVGTSLIVSNSKTDNANTGGVYENGGVVIAAIYFPANLPFRDAYGNYMMNPRYPNISNPLSYETVRDFTDGKRILTSAYAKWEIINGLTLKGNFSYDQSSNKRNSYYPTTFLYGQQVNGMAAIDEHGANSSLTEWTLNYKGKTFHDQLSYDLLAGYSYQITKWEGMNAGNQNFVSDAISYYNLSAGQSLNPTVGSYKSQQVWGSYFARGSIAFKDKYVLQASVRRDGSSNFALNKKWGYFPSVSASWVLSQENFIKNLSLISDLKLRTGYGETGNSSFGGNAFEVYGVSPWASIFTGTNTKNGGMLLSQAANPNLTWETAGELNLGLDFGLLSNRISGSVDLYQKTIRNLITRIPLPADNVTNSVWGNAGKTRSRGYEISIQTRNIVSDKNDGFKWSTSINLSHYLNYWVERSANSLATLPKYIAATGPNALYSGYYGYENNGIFKGKYGTAPELMPGMLPGGIIIKDIHGYDSKGNLTGPDGIISGADQTLLMNWDPKFNIGFGNEFSWKNFDLNIFLSGQVKKGLSPENQNVEFIWAYGINQLKSTLNRWTFQNPDATKPTGITDIKYGPYQGNTDFWIVDASYLRCRNITLGYTVKPERVKKPFSSLRVYVDFQNLFTLTSYPGIDPEVSQGNYYPFSKTYLMGINIVF